MKAKSPLISVIMPVFNSELFVSEAVDSILKQTVREFEFLIIYDVSTDKTFSIISSYQNLDPRIRVIIGKKKSLVGALNQGINVAKGKFIARMDADDIALPHRFERQLAWLEKTNADITGSWIKLFGSRFKYIIKARETDAAIKTEMLFCCPFKHPTVMMRTAKIKALRYDSAWDLAEDYDLWDRAAEAGWKMTNVQEVLLLYRVHGEQTSTASPEKQLNCTIQIRVRYCERVLQELGLDSKHVDNFSKLCVFTGTRPNLDELDLVVMQLIKSQIQSEARDVLMDQLALQYILAAVDSVIIITKRKTLLLDLILHKLFLFQLLLWFIHFFQIHPGKTRGLSLINHFYFRFISNSWVMKRRGRALANVQAV